MKIKVCGLTTKEEALFLNQNHIDLAGMVLFFQKSKRNISLEQAKQIMECLSPETRTVAVTVAPSIEQALAIQEAGFDYLQIHGDIPAGFFDAIQIPVLKAFNVKDMAQYQAWHSCPGIAGYVFDAQEPGSGKTFDWNLVKDIPRDEKLLLLAGGLTPSNVQEAIAAVHPDGVDVSSGVEYENMPGKDPQKIRAFAEAVIQAS